MSAKKYKLFKADGSNNEPAPCAFFLSAQGCKNGDKCRFAHKLPSDNKTNNSKPQAVRITDSSSDVVSSESEASNSQPPPKQIATKKKRQNDNAAVTPKKAQENNNSEVSSNKKKRKLKETDTTSDDMDLGLFSKPRRHQSSDTQTPQKKNEVVTAQASSKANTTPKVAVPKPSSKSTPNNKKAKKTDDALPSFRALNLPIATFNMKDGTVKNEIPKTTSSEEEKTQNKEEFPLPQSTKEGLIWQNAVLSTRSNPKYKSIFNFEKMKQLDLDNGVGKPDEWIKARPFGSWCAGNPHAIAIDCEMCETKDPVSGSIDHKALCRLSVVNAINTDDVLIDTLVKPEWPVTDDRSRINGIKKDALESVQFTLSHAQAFMVALCSEETVIIGHALQNDLAALKMEHNCNADSAMLFTCKDAPNATCSLKDLASSVLKKEMPNIHCSVNDARTASICIEDGFIKTNGKTELIERSFSSKTRRSSNDLFVHRIPKGCQPEHIKNMFLSHTSIQPEEVTDIIYNSDTGKTTVSFLTSGHAKLAFDSFDNEEKPDKTGRMQKRVYLRNGGYAYIRKMTMDKKKSKSDVLGNSSDSNKTNES